MNIERRLRISNLLMVLVPVVIAVAVGAGAVVVAWHELSRGAGIGVDDSADFFQACDVIAAVADPLIAVESFGALEENASLGDMLDSSGMTLVVRHGSDLLYTSGALDASGEELVAAASASDADIDLSSGGRCVAAHSVKTASGSVRVCIVGDVSAGSEQATKQVILFAAAALAIVLVVTVALLNRFLTLFVLRHIRDPLDLLSRGTHKIRDGELSFRLPQQRADEFAPVFADFNDMAQRLSASVERDRRAEEKRKTLLVGLSHDLRSPLTSIQAYVEGIIDGVAKTPEDVDRYLVMIKRKAEEMTALLARLSALVKMDARADRPELKSTDLAAFVADWADVNREAYRLQRVRIEVRAVPARARIDDELMGRILSNLLDNCARYATREGACTVYLECGIDARRGAWVAVDDDGPGVDDDELGRLFDFFFRGDSARTATGEGNGIGLGVVALAMGNMGGCVVAERSRRGGLRVLLSFPADTVAEGGAHV